MMSVPEQEIGCEFLARDGEGLCARVDLTVYSLPALLRVAHRFTDRCHLHIEREGEAAAILRFRMKTSGADLSYLAGEFLNELLDQSLREMVQKETEPVRNLILAHALSETSLLRPDLETADPFPPPEATDGPDTCRAE